MALYKQKTWIGLAQSLPIILGMGCAEMAEQLDDTDSTETKSMQLEDRKKQIILRKAEIELEELGEKVTAFKIYDPESNSVYGAALDENGKPVDLDDLIKRNEMRRDEKYHAMHPALYNQVQRSKEDELLPVLIKLNIPETFIDKSRFKEGDIPRAEFDKNREATEARAKALFSNHMAQMLVKPDNVRVTGPFVKARLSAGAIAALAKDESVAFIGPDEEKIILDYPTIQQSLPTTRTHFAHSAGFKGAGVKVTVLESGLLTVSSACFNIAAQQTASGSGSSHMTMSYGIIANRYNAGLCNGSWDGYAPSATELMANGSDYTAAYTWAKDQGTNVITMSWHYPSEETSGALHSRDIFFDYWSTQYPYPSVFTSAGNQAGSGAYASGKGYNFFGVGNIVNDGDGDRCNDVIDSSSSWEDPTSPHNDREVPAIASPGSRHDILGSSFGGTSAATPVTAAITADIMSANATLKYWPEAIRAILLATANYQDGDSQNFSTGLDGKDGTGLNNTWYGYLTGQVRESTTTPQYRAHDYGYMSTASFAGGFFNKTWSAQTFSLSSKIRVALTWNSKTTSTSSVLNSDLDLWVYDPDNILVATSSSWDSNNEFVELTPTKTGTYTIKIRGYTVPADLSTYYAVAWTTHYDICP